MEGFDVVIAKKSLNEAPKPKKAVQSPGTQSNVYVPVIRVPPVELHELRRS